VFDLIEVDLANAREALEAGQLYAATRAACHALLVTKALKGAGDRETFDLFLKHFVDESLVDPALAPVVTEAARAASSSNAVEAFSGSPAGVTTLVANVRVLYESMDSSLRFKTAAR
jgi:hypothetical protein